MSQHLTEISAWLPVIVAMASLLSGGLWVKFQVIALTSEQQRTNVRLAEVEATVAAHIQSDNQSQVQLAADLAEIKAMLRTRPCISHHEEQCRA